MKSLMAPLWSLMMLGLVGSLGAFQATHGGPTPQPEPKPDQTVGFTYTAGAYTMEVAGVCKITESEVRCWDLRGKQSTALTSLVESALKPKSTYVPPIQFQYGKKNRLVIFKQTISSATTGTTSYSISINYLGNSASGGYGGFLNFPMGNYQPGKPQVRYESRPVAAESSAKTTKARLMVIQFFPERATLNCKPGAKAGLSTADIELLSIKKAPAGEQLPPGYLQETRWQIDLKVKLKVRDRLNLGLTAVGPDGKFLSQKTSDGKPISQEEVQKLWSKPGGHRPYSLQSVMVQTGSMNGDRQTCFVNVDPKYIAKLAIGFSKTRNVDMTGIPLDPK
ncbi:MAG: hypothetical protein HZC36_04235 [Armatimonadetes bacterium]|nr:hypothetical protein [Armatimonadota bacterium]